MAFGSKKKQAKNAPTVRDADLISELCDIVDCNEDELKQVVEDLCSFESEGGEFIDGIAKMLDCDEDSIYDEIKRIKELADNSSQGTEEDEAVASARQVIDELLTLFDCTEEDLLSRVQSTQKVANEYYSVLVALCEMLDCTLDTVSERVEELFTNQGTNEAPEVDEDELNSLRESVEKLQSLLEQEKHEKEKYKTAYTDLKAQEPKEKEVSTLRSKLEAYKKEVAELNEQVNKAKEIIKGTRKLRDTLTEENTKLKEEAVVLKSQRDALKGKLSEVEAASKGTDEKKLQELEDSLASKDKELKSTLDELGKSREETSTLAARVKQYEASLDKLQKLNCSLTEENTKLTSTVKELDNEVADLSNKLAKAQSDLDKKSASLDKMSSDYSKVVSTISGYDEKMSRIDELEIELEVYKEKEVQYTKMIDEITSVVDKQEELNGKSILTRLCKKFDCEKEALEEVIDIAVEGKMPEEDSFKGLSIELVKLRSENRVLKKKHSLESQVIESLRKMFDDARLEQLFDLIVAAKDKADESSDLSEKVSTYKADIDRLQCRVRESYDEVTQLKGENDKLKNLQGNYSTILDENKKFKERCSKLESLLNESKSEKTSASKVNESLTSEVGYLKALLSASEGKVANLEEEKSALSHKLKTAEKDLLDAKVESKKSSDRCTELRKSLADTKKALDTANNDSVAEYVEKVKSLEDSLIVEQGKNLQLTTAVEELTDSKDKLLERIRSKDDMIESLKKEVRVQELAAKRLEQRLEGTDTDEE